MISLTTFPVASGTARTVPIWSVMRHNFLSQPSCYCPQLLPTPRLSACRFFGGTCSFWGWGVHPRRQVISNL